jgi:hypothetical protein
MGHRAEECRYQQHHRGVQRQKRRRRQTAARCRAGADCPRGRTRLRREDRQNLWDAIGNLPQGCRPGPPRRRCAAPGAAEREAQRRCAGTADRNSARQRRRPRRSRRPAAGARASAPDPGKPPRHGRDAYTARPPYADGPPPDGPSGRVCPAPGERRRTAPGARETPGVRPCDGRRAARWTDYRRLPGPRREATR